MDLHSHKISKLMLGSLGREFCSVTRLLSGNFLHLWWWPGWRLVPTWSLHTGLGEIKLVMAPKLCWGLLAF